MKLEEYCDALNIEIKAIYYPNQGGRWCASFKDVDVKGDGVLIGQHGNGNSVPLALVNYIEAIRGKTIVVNAFSADRIEFVVPMSLEL